MKISKSCRGMLKTMGKNDKPLRIIIDDSKENRRNKGKLARTKSDFFITSEPILEFDPIENNKIIIPDVQNKDYKQDEIGQENEQALSNAYGNIPDTNVNANIEKAHEMLKSGMQKVKQLRMMVSETKQSLIDQKRL